MVGLSITSFALTSWRLNCSIALLSALRGRLNWIMLGCKLLRGPSTRQFFSL